MWDVGARLWLEQMAFRFLDKVEAIIVDHVHLTIHNGHVTPVSLRYIILRRKKLRLTWWQLVVDYPYIRVSTNFVAKH